MRFNSRLRSKDEAIAFIQVMHAYIGGGFHPDDSIAGYVRQDNRKPLFGKANAEMLDRLRMQAHRLLGDKIYDLTESGDKPGLSGKSVNRELLALLELCQGIQQKAKA